MTKTTTLRCPRCHNTYTPVGHENTVRCNGGNDDRTGKPRHVDTDMVEDDGEGNG